MSDTIAFVHSQEVSLINEIANWFVSVIFDGKTRIVEAMAIVLHFVDDEFKIVQRLVKLQVLKLMCAEQIARELITV